MPDRGPRARRPIGVWLGNSQFIAESVHHEVCDFVAAIFQRTGNESVKHLGIRESSCRRPAGGIDLANESGLYFFREPSIAVSGFPDDIAHEIGIQKIAESLFKLPLTPIGFTQAVRIEI